MIETAKQCIDETTHLYPLLVTDFVPLVVFGFPWLGALYSVFRHYSQTLFTYLDGNGVLRASATLSLLLI